ncbi:hypothetical protein METHB2_30075 [Candidatus Methylobacter favarea]|uniref:catalase n=1 Tax=Candidatus Methylobacter favarea TaxID=2707345 RepID=A0A8S0Y9Z1_9GAMM|nr:catalase [Candidatus Methylobacter favarea]CAA9890871.1 hypothetical protein METHB2_30075 [Candidatus Methylobacter favarea]
MSTTDGSYGLKEASGRMESLEPFKSQTSVCLAINRGLHILGNQNCLKSGTRIPTLPDNFIVPRKIARFAGKGSSECLEHASDEAAVQCCQVYRSKVLYTKAKSAKSVQYSANKTPVFGRFFAVIALDSAGTIHQGRRLAVKFYTGNEATALKIVIFAAAWIGIEAFLIMKSTLEKVGVATKIASPSLGKVFDAQSKSLAVDQAEDFLLKMGIKTNKTSMPSEIIIGSKTAMPASLAENFIAAIAAYRQGERFALTRVNEATTIIRAVLQREA